MTNLTTPIKRKAMTKPAAHGVKAELVLSLHPHGILAIREAGRRASSEVLFDCASLYVEGVKRRIAAEKQAKRQAKSAKRKTRL